MVLFYLLLGLALFYLVYLFLAWFRQTDTAQIARSLKLLMSGALFFVLLLTLITGRVGLFLIGAVALIPFYPRLYRLIRGEPASGPVELSQKGSSAPLTVEEACHILGVEESASKQEILKAHKKLIRALHPDQGGSDYLAARVNQAKDFLIEALDKA